MKRLVLLYFALFLPLVCLAQTSQAPVTSDELQYFRYLLMKLANPGYDARFIRSEQDALVYHFGLNQSELAAIENAALSLNALVRQNIQKANAITANKPSLSATDYAALEALATAREQMIVTLADQILNGVRPETADRLRKPGAIVANAVRAAASKGGK